MSATAITYTQLNATTAVTNLVSNRIWPDAAKRTDDEATPTLPYIVHRVSSRDRNYHLTGAPALQDVFVELTIYAANSVSRQAVKDAVESAFDALPGTVGNWNVRSSRLRSEVDDYLDPEDDSEEGVFVSVRDYQIVFKPST